MNKILLGSVLSIAAIAIAVAIGVATISLTPVNTPSDVKPSYYDQFMEDLPAKSESWGLMMREFESKYVDLDMYEEEFYKRPEFYADSWDACKERYYKNHDYRIWGVYGHGAYPGNRNVVFGNSDVGEWISFYSFYRSGWGIETWQGIKLVPESNRYFDVKIEPDEFLLTPTFPKFTYNWSRKIKYTVTIKEKPPSGAYTVIISTDNPAEELAFKWFWEVLKRETSPEEQETLEKCYEQVINDNIDIECDEWIRIARKNKYVDCGQLKMGNRMVIEIFVS